MTDELYVCRSSFYNVFYLSSRTAINGTIKTTRPIPSPQNIVSTSQQLSSAIVQLFQGAGEQASFIEQESSTMEKISWKTVLIKNEIFTPTIAQLGELFDVKVGGKDFFIRQNLQKNKTK